MNNYPPLLSTIGNTPLIQLHGLSTEYNITLLAKQESRNPLGSVKDRVALALIEAGEKAGEIGPETTIIEPTSGNTGLGLALVCAVKKLRLILTMPESMSIERRKMLVHLGAELVLTPASKGMQGSIDTAERLKREIPDSYVPNQFFNPACPAIHKKTTGVEIWNQTEGEVDIFVAGVGTGGTITGVGELLKEKKPSVKIIAVEPADSPVLSGGKAGPHKIQGIGAGFVPGILNTHIIDEIITVDSHSAYKTARSLAKDEGLLCGISSGAAVWAALQLGQKEQNMGKTIVTVLPDTGERYLSTDLLN